MKNSIGVIGLWHLGCVISASWSKLGNDIIGFDYDTSRIKELNKGNPPLFEPGLEDTINEGVATGRMIFSDDIDPLSNCDFIFLSHDTPVRDDDTSDTDILEKSVHNIRHIMKESSVLIISSQTPVGLCSKLRRDLKKQNPSLDLAYSPENLRLGEAINCYLNPGRIILGTADPDTEKKCKVLFSSIKAEIQSMSLESAEMVKHGINSFLAASIVFANHLADICEMTGAKIDDVAAGMKSDPRIGSRAYLAPGIGFSGGTLGRDLRVLDQINFKSKGYARLFGFIHELNAERKNAIIDKITTLLGDLKGKKIGILGLTYKPGTSTLRRSLPLEIANLLVKKDALVKAYDPKADFTELKSKPRFHITKSIQETADSSDMLVLLTEWPEFRNADLSNIPRIMRSSIFFDTKNFLEEAKMVAIGFQYHSIGR